MNKFLSRQLQSLVFTALLLYCANGAVAAPSKATEAQPVIQGYPIPGLGPTRKEMSDPAWDVPVVPALPEKPGAVPSDAVPVRGYDINKGIKAMRSTNSKFNLKYCYARAVQKTGSSKPDTVYMIDPADYQLMFGTKPKSVTPRK